VNLTVDGKLRDYRLFMPSTIDGTKPLPLVIVLHGSPIDAAGFEDFIHFDSEAEAAGFLEASPNGCNGFWDYAEGRPKTADEDFIKSMIQHLEKAYSIDRTRVFAVGASAGSWVAYRLACDLGGTISAIASLSGTMRLNDPCVPSHPVSILEMHGTLDEEHPWQGGGPHGAFPVDDVIQRWVSLDGCVGSPVVSQTGADVTSTWGGCAAGVRVRLDKILGGDHGWFLSPATGVPEPKTTAWSFFASMAS
jgi:polyhydroxybutyrate depolymerase